MLAFAGMTGTAAASATACAGASAIPTSSNLVALRSTITCLVNAERVKRGLPILRTSGLLRDAAIRHSADMVRRGYFSHVTPAGVSVRGRLSRAGIRATSVGENIGWGMGGESTAAIIVSGWMRSASHRANTPVQALHAHRNRRRAGRARARERPRDRDVHAAVRRALTPRSRALPG